LRTDIVKPTHNSNPGKYKPPSDATVWNFAATGGFVDRFDIEPEQLCNLVGRYDFALHFQAFAMVSTTERCLILDSSGNIHANLSTIAIASTRLPNTYRICHEFAAQTRTRHTLGLHLITE
jgi:hypothetical protein